MNTETLLRPGRPEPLAPAPHYMLRVGSDRCVDLGVETGSALLRLRGQVLGPAEPGSAELAAEGAGRRDAQVVPLDDGGAFLIDAVRPGVYVLTLRLAEDTLELPAFRIGSAEG